MLNPVSNGKILDWPKPKAFADNKINITQKLKFVVEWVENIVGIGENAGNQHFLFFPQCFQKASFPGSLNGRSYWYSLPHNPNLYQTLRRRLLKT